ncbi:hypothetical protein CZ771_09050 [Actinomycetales bacterium JB111]|nr:hypothetical protein CZ771_09050 [Actinomycetales bacterium JB111]
MTPADLAVRHRRRDRTVDPGAVVSAGGDAPRGTPARFSSLSHLPAAH